MPLRFATKDAGRPHVLEATTVIVNRYNDGESITSGDLPPRTGKSSIIQLSALELSALGTPWILAVAPWEILPGQLSEPKKIDKTIERYCDPFPPADMLSVDRVRHIKGPQFYEREGTKPFLFCATLPLLYLHANAAILAIQDAIERYQRRPAVMFDEGHLASSTNDWGAMVERIVDNGAYAVVLTGTAIRRDGKLVPGFNVKWDDTWDERLRRLRRRKIDQDGRVHHIIDTYNEKSRNGVQTADVDMPWQEAWEKGYLNAANILWADAEIELDGTTQLLSEIPTNIVNSTLRALMEHEKVIRKAVELGVGRLYQWRNDFRLPKTKMLVTTGADIDREKRGKADNYHARAVRRELEEAILLKFGEKGAQGVRVEIATTTMIDEGESGKNASSMKIDAFRGVAAAIAEVGEIDVLIVKSMGLVGLDVPELKVQICLSTLREGPMMLQERSRALTVWEDEPTAKHRPSTIVLPKDKRNQDIVEKMRKAGGIKETETVKVKEEETDPDPSHKPDLIINNVFLSQVTDHEGREEDFSDDYEAAVRAVRNNYPSVRSLTDPMIVAMYRDGAFPIADEEAQSIYNEQQRAKAASPKVVRLDDETARLRGKFGERAAQLISAVWSYTEAREQWQKALAALQNGAKIRAQVNVPVPSIDDPAILKRLLQCLEHEFQAVYGRRGPGL